MSTLKGERNYRGEGKQTMEKRQKESELFGLMKAERSKKKAPRFEEQLVSQLACCISRSAVSNSLRPHGL